MPKNSSTRKATLDRIIDASIDYPARPEYVEKARASLRGLGSLADASLVDFLQDIPDAEERSEAALAFMGVFMRGDR